MAATNKEALWAQGHDETVELLQNSDDAGAPSAEIHFRTRSYLDNKVSRVNGNTALPDLKTTPVHEYMFRNSGQVFRDEDWKRLKKIADGNPDEEKIGAFGVGFYSIFSVCEAPIVTSGTQWMGFYFKDGTDQLFVRRGNLPTPSEPVTGTQWTEFSMPLRESSPMPNAFDFTRFLVTSLTFMRTLSEVSIWFDDVRLSIVTKATGPEKALGLPRGLRARSGTGAMTVSKVTSRALHIKAEVLRWVYSAGSEKPKQEKAPQPTRESFFSSIFSGLSSSQLFTPPRTPQPTEPPKTAAQINEELMGSVDSSVLLAVYSAHANVKLDPKLAVELQRSTKKNAPSQVRVDLIYTGKDEYDESVAEEEKQKLATGIFKGLRADLDGSGTTKVFIGHSTGQTTGLGGHLSARFIPTVERESIDLQDRNVAVWNRELLYVGGYLARAAYELEMSQLRELWDGVSVTGDSSKAESQAWLQKRATHALRFFTFHPSHPSLVVSELLELGFFGCAEQRTFPMLSTKGILDANRVRMPNPDFSFLETLPVVHPDIVSGAPQMVTALRRRGFLADIQFKDVLDELRARPLTEKQMVECLKWRARLNTDGLRAHEATLRREFLDACIFVPDGEPDKLVALSSVKTFISPQAASRIIVDGPLPRHTLPFSVSRQVPAEQLNSMLGWTELSVVEWLSYVVAPDKPHAVEFDIAVSAVWAERVLQCLARDLPTLSQTDKTDVVARLAGVTCIPTKAGMVTPDKAYFMSVNLFQDLPIVALPKTPAVRGNLEKLLTLLGVRRHVDLQLVFTRMIGAGEWNTYQLVKYLCSVQSTLTEDEITRLSATRAFPSEGVDDDKEKLAPGARPQRFAPRDLYEPTDTFRAMNLPVLKWDDTHKWRASSDEAQFLAKVGLRKFPPLDTLLELASGKDAKAAATALRYLLDNVGAGQHYEHYHPSRFPNSKFVPAVKPDGTKTMETPLNVFASPDCAVMGFTVLDAALRSEARKLHVDEYPSAARLVDVLSKNPPTDQATARAWFEFLAGRSGDFSPPQFAMLKTLKFIPATKQVAGKEQTQLMSPKEVFFGGGAHAAKRAHFSQLFTFVDFGERAKTFLRSCGVADEPNPDEIVQMLIADPKRFYKLAGGYDGFLDELRFIAANERSITPSTRAKLKSSPAFVATKMIPKKIAEKAKPEDGEDDLYEAVHDLIVASNAVINDDQLAASLFASEVFCAPQEDMLEGFYAQFGSPRLSGLIKEEYRVDIEVKDTAASGQAEQIRALIVERLPLFLNDMRATSRSLELSWDWLQKPGNFYVSMVRKIIRVITFQQGIARKVESQDVSASARHATPTSFMSRPGPLALSLSQSASLDMYDVASGLCRLILKVPRSQDSLLLLTLLTTDLRSLRRRGYNIDRILQRQVAERRALQEAAAAERKAEAEQLAKTQATNTRLLSDDEVLEPRAGRNSIDQGRPVSPDNHRMSSRLRGLFGIKSEKHDRPQGDTASEIESPRTPGSTIAPPPPPSRSTRPQLPSVVNTILSKPEAHATPKSEIDRNVQQAIAGCRPENSTRLRDRTTMTMVKEAQNEGYCDISGRVEDLELVGTVSGVKIFIAPSIPERQAVFQAKMASIERFLFVVNPLRDLYKLPPSSLHIFLDASGPTIAFNRGGSLFLNLRYYEAWHDQDVLAGKPGNAYKSWFFSLAHEIAHNLVQQHDAEHEFYFSTISQAHVSGLATLLLQHGP
ncbi:hypothetical protein BKA62DRAFT_829923 [Auriculariales sp. MPI-PUGE-AT-0066]|nr:hypothetical protein BKA62DRAFT_829923 [Auriculariales sp. MPI-PUGE-AT-0066]